MVSGLGGAIGYRQHHRVRAADSRPTSTAGAELHAPRHDNLGAGAAGRAGHDGDGAAGVDPADAIAAGLGDAAGDAVEGERDVARSLTCARIAGPPSPPLPAVPVTVTVVIVPSGAMRRMRLPAGVGS
jgi:hypothetical protein